MFRQLDLKALRRRTVEIDYVYGHRHLPGSLSALPIIASIYQTLDPAHDVFILSKGHACAAFYAVLEAVGYSPDCSKVHPERDPANGIEMTSGSLGHGLPTAVGIALAKKLRNEPGKVHVLLGDGETQEGTTWEGIHLAENLCLHRWLNVHVDNNEYQGSGPLISGYLHLLSSAYPIKIHETLRGEGVPFFRKMPSKSVHQVIEPEFAEIMESLK